MNKLLTLASLLILAACSDNDLGLRYSETFETQKRVDEASATSNGCAFKDVAYETVADGYSAKTESLISELYGKYVTDLEPLDSKALSGQVKYSEWLENTEDKVKACIVADHFANTDATQLSGNIKKAFFINAYNFFTIDLILKNYSRIEKGEDRDKGKFPNAKSIINIDDLGFSVWDTFKWAIGNQSLTLNEIEKGILIPMKDARIHFAVNCASKGCPPLKNEAYSASQLDEQLDEMADFFVSSSGYHDFKIVGDYNPSGGDNVYYLSPIFQWYADDFKNDVVSGFGSVRGFLVRHIKTSEENLGFPLDDLLNEAYWREDFKAYDWSLNEVGI